MIIPKIIASVVFPEQYNAKTEQPNKIVCNTILIVVVTGIAALGDINVPHMTATRIGVPIPISNLVSSSSIKMKAPI